MAASATTPSTTCGSFFNFRSSNSSDQSYRVRDSSSSPTSSPGCGGKLDGVAMWFVNGVTMAFFASLNRCSCIRISTKEDSEDANDLPLMFDDGNLRHDGVSAAAAATTSRRRTGKGEKSGAVLVD